MVVASDVIEPKEDQTQPNPEPLEDISLKEKLKQFSLDDAQIQMFLYGICLSETADRSHQGMPITLHIHSAIFEDIDSFWTVTLKEGVNWLSLYAKSAGKYAKCPYLVNVYGCVSEIVQAYCRFVSFAIYGIIWNVCADFALGANDN